MRRQLTIVALVLTLIVLYSTCSYAMTDDLLGISYVLPDGWSAIEASVDDEGIVLVSYATSSGSYFVCGKVPLLVSSIKARDVADSENASLNMTSISNTDTYYGKRAYAVTTGIAEYEGNQYPICIFVYMEQSCYYEYLLYDYADSSSYEEVKQFLNSVIYPSNSSNTGQEASSKTGNVPYDSPIQEASDQALSKALISVLILGGIMFLLRFLTRKKDPKPAPLPKKQKVDYSPATTSIANPNTVNNSKSSQPDKTQQSRKNTETSNFRGGSNNKGFSTRLVEQESIIKDSFASEGKLASFRKLNAVCKSWALENPEGALAAAQLASSFNGTVLTHNEYKELIAKIPTWASSSCKKAEEAELIRSTVTKYVDAITAFNQNYQAEKQAFINKAKMLLPGTDDDLSILYDQWDSVVSENKLRGKDAAISLTKRHIDYWAEKDAEGYIYASTLTGLLADEIITKNEQNDLLKYARAQILSNAVANTDAKEVVQTNIDALEDADRAAFAEEAMKSFSGTKEGFFKVYDQWHVIQRIYETVDKDAAMEELRSCISVWCRDDDDGISYSTKLIGLFTGNMLSEEENQEMIQYAFGKQIENLVSITPEKLLNTDPIHIKKLSAAYGRFNKELIGSIFDGGLEQANIVVTSMADIYGKDLHSIDADLYYRFLKSYVDVFIRKTIIQCTDEHVMASLMDLYPELVSNKDIASIVDAFVTLNSVNHNVSMLDSRARSTIMYFADTFKMVEDASKLNADAEDAFLDDPEYGLVPEKPIYTHGVAGSNEYLDNLCGPSGEKLIWSRTHTTTSPGITGIIDVYQGKLSTGANYKVLYINMYGTKNSSAIPRGFTRNK